MARELEYAFYEIDRLARRTFITSDPSPHFIEVLTAGPTRLAGHGELSVEKCEAFAKEAGLIAIGAWSRHLAREQAADRRAQEREAERERVKANKAWRAAAKAREDYPQIAEAADNAREVDAKRIAQAAE